MTNSVVPMPKAPVATYIPDTRTGNIVYISGQISSNESGPVVGRLGDNMNVVQGGNAAELDALLRDYLPFQAPTTIEALQARWRTAADRRVDNS